jgi:glycine/D-amino acid oxidase-like deaminating enzyme
MAELALSPDRIVQLYGKQRGDEVIATSAGAPDLVFDVIARHGIACDAVRKGWIEGTPFAGGMRSMEKRVASWRRRGAPVDLLDRATIRRLSGTSAYAGGILDHRAGILNPLAYNHGLAIAALRHGAIIHGEVEARRLVQEGGRWQIETNRGILHADTVIAATNAYTGRLLPGLRFPVICMHGVQSATVPVAELRHILPQRHGFSDVRKRFFRLDPEGRLIIGGPGMPWRPHDGRSFPFRLIERALHRLFPETRQFPIEHRWYARGAAAVDLLPHLYEPAPGLFAALGFAGRGIAMGTALGFLLARRAKGETTVSIGFPETRAHWPMGIGALLR